MIILSAKLLYVKPGSPEGNRTTCGCAKTGGFISHY